MEVFFSEFYGNVLPDVRENGFREIFAFGIRIPIIFFNFCLYNPESSTLESGLPLMIVIRNPISTEKECGIHIDESRIQDCLGFPRNGRSFVQKLKFLFFALVPAL